LTERLLPNDSIGIDDQLRRIGWSWQGEHGWICPQHGNHQPVTEGTTKPVLTHRTRALIQAIHDGHDFGMAIMRETGLPESTVYATLRRLQAAGLTVCELEPAEVAMTRQRPQRKIYRLTDLLLNEWAGRANTAATIRDHA